MKKLLLASALMLGMHNYSIAATPVAPEFVKSEQLLADKDYKGAYQEFNRLAQTGNGQALYNLGLLTEFGQGTAKDPKLALKYYQDAANKGYVLSNYKLAQVYIRGDLGLTKDPVLARKYLEKAADQGLETANVELAMLLFSEEKPESDQIALKKLQPFIDKGSKQAMHAKSIYQISQGFKSKNVKLVNEGLASLYSLAEQGYIPAMLATANMFTNGNIVPQNLPEARKIFALLASKNIANAKESVAYVDKLIAEQKAKTASKKP